MSGVREDVNSGEAWAGGGMRAYICKGYDNGVSAFNAVIATAPSTFNGLPVTDWRTRWMGRSDEYYFRVELQYGVPKQIQQNLPAGQHIYRFDTTGGSAHFTQSRGTVAAYAAPCWNAMGGTYKYSGTYPTGSWSHTIATDSWHEDCSNCLLLDCHESEPPDDPARPPADGEIRRGIMEPNPGEPPRSPPNFGGAIGVTDSGVEGADVPVPQYLFEHELTLSAADFATLDSAGTLRTLSPSVNNGTFLSAFAAGECLFLGATGSIEFGKETGTVNLKFSVSPNVTGLQIGEITGITKRGWDYLWVRYQDAEDETSGILVKKPIAVYIEQMFLYADFSALETLINA